MEISAREQGKKKKQAHFTSVSEKLFAAEGYHAASMNEIAKQAGYTKRTLYQYYTSKQDLFFAVLHQGYEQLLEVVRKASNKTGTGFEKLNRCYKAFYEFYKNKPDLLCCMGMISTAKSGSEADPVPYRNQFYQTNTRLFAEIGALFSLGVEDKSIRSDKTPAQMMQSSVFILTAFFNLFGAVGKPYLDNFGIKQDCFIETSLEFLTESFKNRA